MKHNLLLNPNLGLLAMRLMIGVIGVVHGGQKLFGFFGGMGLKKFADFLASMNVPVPPVSAFMAGAAEFFGGILIAIGLLTRVSSLFFAFTMFVAFLTAHHGKFTGEGGGEYALSLGVFAVGLFLTGPGRYGIGALIGGKKVSH